MTHDTFYQNIASRVELSRLLRAWGVTKIGLQFARSHGTSMVAGVAARFAAFVRAFIQNTRPPCAR